MYSYRRLEGAQHNSCFKENSTGKKRYDWCKERINQMQSESGEKIMRRCPVQYCLHVHGVLTLHMLISVAWQA